jgi:hypothetical protein
MDYWKPISTAPTGVFLLVCGPSGYTSIPIRVHVAQFIQENWYTHSNDLFTDDGLPPTHWKYLTIPSGY